MNTPHLIDLDYQSINLLHPPLSLNIVTLVRIKRGMKSGDDSVSAKGDTKFLPSN